MCGHQALAEAMTMPMQLGIYHTCGLFGFAVPFALEVSGVPSLFWLFSGLLVISVECLVSVLLKPSCFPD